tara:strand:- start:759 stop:884 length:126 start_codon:yes stop_codon:yes gene_type:complete
LLSIYAVTKHGIIYKKPNKIKTAGNKANKPTKIPIIMTQIK